MAKGDKSSAGLAQDVRSSIEATVVLVPGKRRWRKGNILRVSCQSPQTIEMLRISHRAASGMVTIFVPKFRYRSRDCRSMIIFQLSISFTVGLGVTLLRHDLFPSVTTLAKVALMRNHVEVLN